MQKNLSEDIATLRVNQAKDQERSKLITVQYQTLLKNAVAHTDENHNGTNYEELGQYVISVIPTTTQ